MGEQPKTAAGAGQDGGCRSNHSDRVGGQPRVRIALMRWTARAATVTFTLLAVGAGACWRRSDQGGDLVTWNRYWAGPTQPSGVRDRLCGATLLSCRGRLRLEWQSVSFGPDFRRHFAPTIQAGTWQWIVPSPSTAEDEWERRRIAPSSTTLGTLEVRLNSIGLSGRGGRGRVARRAAGGRPVWRVGRGGHDDRIAPLATTPRDPPRPLPPVRLRPPRHARPVPGVRGRQQTRRWRRRSAGRPPMNIGGFIGSDGRLTIRPMRHFTSLADHTPAELRHLMDVARTLKQQYKSTRRNDPILAGADAGDGVREAKFADAGSASRWP